MSFKLTRPAGWAVVAMLTLIGANASAKDDSEKLKGRVEALEAQVAELQYLLGHFTRDGSVVTIEDADVVIDGGNLHVRNGDGATDTTNGLGNIIIGYNELRGASDDRSGSHMLVLGDQNSYSSYGGIVAGFYSTTSGAYASITGGWNNTASGPWASVTGGQSNTASGERSSVTGGSGNTASGPRASVSGGLGNTASALNSSVSGGSYNHADGIQSTVSGGTGTTENSVNGHPDTHTP